MVLRYYYGGPIFQLGESSPMAKKRWAYVVSFVATQATHFQQNGAGPITEGYFSREKVIAFVADENLIEELRSRIPNEYPGRKAFDQPLKIVEMYFGSLPPDGNGLVFHKTREVSLLGEDWAFAYFVHYDELTRVPRPIYWGDACVRQLYPFLLLVETKRDISRQLQEVGLEFRVIH